MSAGELAFPSDGSFGSARAFRCGAARGVAYAGVPAALAASVPGWIEARAVPAAEVLKRGRVFRAGALIVKFFPRATPFGLLRRARAVRSAERYFACLPVPSPRPLLAARARLGGVSLLVREFVPGRLLSEVWTRDAGAMEALAPFLALMTRRRVLHGDLHPSNLLWDGTRWLLLDVDGVRHRLHSPRRVTVTMWARLLQRLEDGPELRALHARYLELGAEPAARAPRWEAVERRARHLRPARDGG